MDVATQRRLFRSEGPSLEGNALREPVQSWRAVATPIDDFEALFSWHAMDIGILTPRPDKDEALLGREELVTQRLQSVLQEQTRQNWHSTQLQTRLARLERENRQLKMTLHAARMELSELKRMHREESELNAAQSDLSSTDELLIAPTGRRPANGSVVIRRSGEPSSLLIDYDE